MDKKNNFKKIFLFFVFSGIFAVVFPFLVFADSCQDECSYSLQFQCSESRGRTCGNYDSDTCLEWSLWTYNSQCSNCGDGVCNSYIGESIYSCPGDCGHPMIYDCFDCGDGSCDASCGENQYTCARDCGGPNNHPVAEAGVDKEVYEGDSVMIEGSGHDPNEDWVTYRWSCETGSLSNYNIAKPYFYAPQVAVSVRYYCNLIVTDKDGLTASDRMYIMIKDKNSSAFSSSLSIAKTGKNLTKGDTIWSETIVSSPSDIVQFRITVTNTGTTTTRNVIVRDILPSNLSYWGGLNIDGIANGGAILTGANIGDLYAGQTKTVIFDAKLSPAESFNYGVTTLSNSATANGDNISQVNDTATVSISRGQVAGAVTEIDTGINPWLTTVVVSTLITILLMILSMFNRYLIPRNRTWRKIMDKVSMFKLYMFSN